MKAENQNKQLRVLYVEDSRVDLELVKNILEEDFDLNLVSVEDKAGYLQTLENSKEFDLILSDYNLPDFNAIEALRIANQWVSDIPFICISGTIGEEKAVDLLKDGAVDYVLKDRMGRLVPSIKRALKGAEEKRNLELAQKKLRERNQELLIAKQKAEESDRLKSVFLSNMSHEIRTPLNGILGFSELLIQATDSLKKNKYVSTIQDSCEQLMHIIDSIVDISIIEADQVQIHKENVEIGKVFTYVASVLQPEFRKKGVLLSQGRTSENLTYLITDERKLIQIFINLIRNSLKFTQQGYVEYGFQESELGVVFYVEDTGIGIAPENQKMIFERFRQVDEGNTRTFGGAGLGLAISKSFVTKMGGEIWLESTPGEGSTFYFSIPLD